MLPRLFREAPVNAIWEGSGNVQCLDVIRAVAKKPAILDTWRSELRRATGRLTLYDAAVSELEQWLIPEQITPENARFLTEKMAITMQAAQLILSGNSAIAEAFCEARLAHQRGLMWGTLPRSISFSSLLQRL